MRRLMASVAYGLVCLQLFTTPFRSIFSLHFSSFEGSVMADAWLDLHEYGSF